MSDNKTSDINTIIKNHPTLSNTPINHWHEDCILAINVSTHVIMQLKRSIGGTTPYKLFNGGKIMNTSFRFLLVVFIAVCCFSASSLRSFAQERIGGEFAFTFGAQTGPFKMGTGWFFAGEVGLPLMDLGPGKVLGLINIGMSNSDDSISIEPTVNALVPGAVPTQTTLDLTTVSIVLGLKYKLLAHNVVQPYILAGPGIDIFFNDTEPGGLPGAIAPQPQELIDRGFPGGQGNVELGLHAGGGIDFNITEKIFIGAEGRFNWVDRDNGSYGTYGGRLGFRF